MSAASVSAKKAELRRELWKYFKKDRGLQLGDTSAIPDFAGSEGAAVRLLCEKVGERARCILVQRAGSLLAFARLALHADKTLVFVRGSLNAPACFLRVDAAAIPTAHRDRAVSDDGLERFAKPVRPSDLDTIDLAVVGALAVDAGGSRIGPGGSGFDLAWAILRECGKLSVKTPVAAIVHPSQIVRQPLPMAAQDFPIDLIVTPSDVLLTHTQAARPWGVDPAALTPELRAKVAFLRDRPDPAGKPGLNPP